MQQTDQTPAAAVCFIIDGSNNNHSQLVSNPTTLSNTLRLEGFTFHLIRTIFSPSACYFIHPPPQIPTESGSWKPWLAYLCTCIYTECTECEYPLYSTVCVNPPPSFPTEISNRKRGSTQGCRKKNTFTVIPLRASFFSVRCFCAVFFCAVDYLGSVRAHRKKNCTETAHRKTSHKNLHST